MLTAKGTSPPEHCAALAAQRIISVASIVAVHGLRGWLKLHPDGQHQLLSGDVQWHLCAEREQWQAIERGDCRLERSSPLVRLAGIEERDEAKRFIGAQLGVLRDQLPELEEGNYYWCDLIGLEVVGAGGIVLGTVQRMFATAANDVMEVAAQDAMLLIPFAPAYIVDVDLAGGRLVTKWRPEY